MKNNIVKLFVYGTLRKGFHHPAFDYIARHFYFVGEATVQGKLYDFGEFPGAVPTSEQAFIKGELYELKEAGEFDWAIEQLDDYEGLNPEEGEEKLYDRQLTGVYCNGNVTRAWMYWYNQDFSGRTLIASGDVFDKAGYKSNV